MITREEITKGQDIPKELEPNLEALLDSLNMFRAIYGKPMIVTSGYRSPEYNEKIGGARKSAHCLCMAADFRDADKSIANFVKSTANILEKCGLYMEDPKFTSTWCHLQIRPTNSGQRVFRP